jgi:hypothetical protein
MARAGTALALFLAAPAAFAQAPGSQVPNGPAPSSPWVPPSTRPTLPPNPRTPAEIGAYTAALQAIYDSSAAIMGQRLAQFSSDAKALKASHTLVLNALSATRSPDALVSCVKIAQAGDDAALTASFRKDLETARHNLNIQQQTVTGALRKAFPFGAGQTQALTVQYMALSLNTVAMAQTLIRANGLQ